MEKMGEQIEPRTISRTVEDDEGNNITLCTATKEREILEASGVPDIKIQRMRSPPRLFVALPCISILSVAPPSLFA